MRFVLALVVVVAALTPGCRLFSEGIACDPDDPNTCPDGTTCNDGICVAGDAPAGVPVCGDGVKNGDEDCDFAADNTCNFDCTTGSCGDGKVSGVEACDDANDIDTDGCAACVIVAGPGPGSVCGDGVKDDGEDCDFAAEGPCNLDCTASVCGDGKVGTDESCDVDVASCVACEVIAPDASCGNGVVDDGEACDFRDDDACNADCTVSVCGDGKVAANEVCDDNNTLPEDGCADDCTAFELRPFCGDGVVNGNEDCDGQANCTPACRFSICGDGFVDGVEECDGGAFCRPVSDAHPCTVIRCGDGIVDAPEQCDGTPGCNANCDFARTACQADGTDCFEVVRSIDVSAAVSNQPVGPFDVDLVDVDDDGALDITAMCRFNVVGPLVVRGDGNGGFTLGPPTSPTNRNSFLEAVGDYDNDGFLDIAAFGDNLLSIYYGRGDGTFDDQTAPFDIGDDPRDMVGGDINGDGIDDVVLITRNFNGVHVLLGAGSRTSLGFTFGGTGGATNSGFVPSNGVAASIGGRIGDFDGDNLPDLIVANDGFNRAEGGAIVLMHGLGGGQFDEGVVVRDNIAEKVRSVEVGDIDDDGNADAIVGRATGGLLLLFGDGAGGFDGEASLPTGGGFSTVTARVTDYNDDGINDLVAVEANKLLFFTGTQNRTFAAPFSVVLGGNGGFFDLDDVDGDGFDDAVVTLSDDHRIIVVLNRPAG